MNRLFLPLRRRLAICCAVLLVLSQVQAIANARDLENGSLIGGKDSGLINLLLIGTDSSQQSASRSDSLILCTFQPEGKQVTITSFLRDLYVPIPGHESNRINAAYAFGGMELVQQTVQEDFGVYVDGCIEVDFSNFSKIIDVLGGVTVELRQDEAEAINKKVPGSLSEGENRLTGSQALAYSRIRNLDRDGDFSRTERQRKLLSSLLDSYRSASLLTILSTVLDTLPMVSTNLEKKQILVLTARLFPLLADTTVHSQRIPAQGHYSCQTIRKMEVLVADLDVIRSDLRQTLLHCEEEAGD